MNVGGRAPLTLTPSETLTLCLVQNPVEQDYNHDKEDALQKKKEYDTAVANYDQQVQSLYQQHKETREVPFTSQSDIVSLVILL